MTVQFWVNGKIIHEEPIEFPDYPRLKGDEKYQAKQVFLNRFLYVIRKKNPDLFSRFPKVLLHARSKPTNEKEELHLDSSQKRVLNLYARGNSYEKIAQLTKIRTTDVREIMDKLRVAYKARANVQLIYILTKRGII